jgi:uncharacterized protein
LQALVLITKRMSNDKLAQFANQKYLSLETYRKNGQAIATPMWFAEDQGVIYLYTLASAVKVKRIRNNPRVRIVPSDVRGKPRGTWVEAAARVVEEAEAERGQRLLGKKYGWMKRLGDLLGRLKKSEHVVIAISADRD